MMSFLRYTAKRATYDLMRAGVRDSFRSMAAAQKTASESQMRALSAHFLDSISAMPADQVIGYVAAGKHDRRPVTAGNFAEMLEVVHDGALPFVIVEDGRAQLLPPHALKALRIAVKARARLDKIAPPTGQGQLIDGDAASATGTFLNALYADAEDNGATGIVPAAGQQPRLKEVAATTLRQISWTFGVPLAIFLTLMVIVGILELIFGSHG